ncbi:MAG: sulfite exporter TauE/SafE family protein [Clostridiales bacterium]|jgi:uncharacterized membrane protein YfcA|nr:sulfite exporter TauE/SafE family protein [Clostridiales bacterium]MDR2750751.1 sulfite exporter TauE/SafE family protein [Clostridiales bacterium]
MEWLIYSLIGLASGVISGMGIGGGAILIPALSIFFSMDQKTAQNINLIYFVPTAAIALISHAKQGNIEKKPLIPMIVSGVIGAAGGSLLAVSLDASYLRKMFGFFLLAMGAYEFFRKDKKQNENKAENKAEGSN